MNHRRLKPLILPLTLLLALNTLQLIRPWPILAQLLLNAGLAVHTGCILSVSLGKASYKQIRECEQQLKTRSSKQKYLENCCEIMKYPALGCVVLLSLYFLIKNINEFRISILFDLIFAFATNIYGSTRLHKIVAQQLRDNQNGIILQEKYLRWIQNASKYLLCPAFVATLCILFIISRHWWLNNLFALCFAITALKQAGLRSFKIAVPTLWLLFLYDLYWVYQSDVMVTVAKSIDLPLKLQFPYLDENNNIKFSILGLGDIIVPGLFISLCLKYDVDNCILGVSRPKTIEDFKLPLYYISLGLYILGIAMTYAAMFIFKHAQPALVFIVPVLTLSIVINRVLGTRLSLYSYNTQAMVKSEQSSQII